MIHIYGDSHANACFKDLNLNHKNFFKQSITMFRIGRDNIIINLDSNIDQNTIVCLVYGEVDCRCHIQKQINLGTKEDDVIFNLVDKYFTTIQNNIKICKKIIIVAIVPPVQRNEYEDIHGKITHEFPFVGTDDERVRYTRKMNTLLKQKCEENGFVYFNPFEYYEKENGTLKYTLSDDNVHIKENGYFLKRFEELYNTIYCK